MRYLTPLIVAFILTTSSSFSQNKETEREENLKVKKIAFFTEKLNLTVDEAQKFWPVYNEYWKRKNTIIDDRRETMKYISENLNKVSQKEIERCANKYISYLKLEAELLEEFNVKFKNVIPVEKVIKLYLADHEFKTYLLQQIRNTPKKEE